MTFRNRQRLKLMILAGIFFLPLLGAWGMIYWQAGIPAGRTAHGELAPPIPLLSEWPLAGKTLSLNDEDWWLVFDCKVDCNAQADQWWRMHRALGRKAERVTRLRIGGSVKMLPGGVTARWATLPAWHQSSSVWVMDPQGRAVLAYPADIPPKAVLEDIEQLLKVNPAIPKVVDHGT